MPIAIELDVIQGIDEWLHARIGLVTASEMNSVFAKGKDGTTTSSAMRKNYCMRLAIERVTGHRVSTYKSASMDQGNELEETAALKYELRTGLKVRKCGFFKHNSIGLGASPDRIVEDDGTVQIKCFEPTEHAEVLKKKAMPTKYLRQCTTELFLSEKDWLDFVAYNGDFPKNAQLFIFRMYRNSYLSQFHEIESETIRFLKEVEQEVNFIKNYQ